MEVSFKFNSGETGQEMVAAILALFGAAPAAARIVNVSNVISPADNPQTGTDGDDAGPAHNGTHDTEGSPWDVRIHSDKKTVTEKGVWRKRKGVPPQEVAKVQAQLKAEGKYAIGGGGTVAPAAAITVTPTTPPAGLPGLPAMAAPAGLPGLPALAAVETPYQKLVGFIAANLNSPANPAGRFTSEWIESSLKTYQCTDAAGNGSLQSLEAADPEKVKAVHAAFAQALGVAV